ncbi:MAG: hypothetical protein V8R01_01750 [Bacilli bacterium]
MASISIDEFEKALEFELTIYCDDITQGIKKASDEEIKTLVKNTKNDANKKTGKYAKAISSKCTKETSRSKTNTWYVKDNKYQLTHLLDKGHATRNGGRTKGTNFVIKNEEIAVNNYEKKVEEVIRNGS